MRPFRVAIVVLFALPALGAGEDWAGVRFRAGLAEVGADDEAAERLFRQALELAGEDASRQAVSRAGLGRVLLRGGRYAEAIPHLERAAELLAAPGGDAFQRYRNLLRLGEALRARKEPGAAATRLREALPIAGEVEGEGSRTVADLRLLLGRSLLDAGQPEEAIPHLRRALAGGSGSNRDGEAALFEALLATSRFAEAERRCRPKVRDPARAAEGWRDIGRIRLAQGRFDEAEMYVRRARTHSGDPSFAKDLLAEIQHRRGRWK